MIAIHRTRSDLLAELGPRGEPAFACADPADPELLRRESASLRIQGRTRDALLPGLSALLRERFAEVPPELLARDLVRPLKKGLGNAFKHGNRLDEAKLLTVDAEFTPRGALIGVIDQGDGFDVAATATRFRQDQTYFKNRGSGFKTFERSGATISYADGGRTLLLQYLPMSTHQVGTAELASYGAAADGEAVRAALAAHDEFAGREWVRVRVVLVERPRGGVCDLRYLVVARESDVRRGRFKVFHARRHATPEAARAEHVRARSIRGALGRGALLKVPRIVHLGECDARLNLLQFEPVEDLGCRLRRAPEAAESLFGIARGLRALHAGEVHRLPESTPSEELERHAAACARVLEGDLDASVLARRLFQRLVDSRALEQGDRAPVHGDFGWSRVICTPAGPFLDRLGEARVSHPGLDLGGFLADLVRFDRGGYPARAVRVLEAYGLDAGWLVSAEPFVAGALLMRLDRASRIEPEARARALSELALDASVALRA